MVSSTKISRLISPPCISTNDRAGCFKTAASGLAAEQSNSGPNHPTCNRAPLGTWFAFSRITAESLTSSKCSLNERKIANATEEHSDPTNGLAGLESNGAMLRWVKTVLVDGDGSCDPDEHLDWL